MTAKSQRTRGRANAKPASAERAGTETSYVFAAEMVPQGGGAFIVRPGKPLSRLTPKGFARVFGVDRDSVYRWKSEGLIDARFIEPAGRRKFFIAAEAVEVVRAKLMQEQMDR